MSQSPSLSASAVSTSNQRTSSTAACAASTQSTLDALADAVCREILGKVGERALSASEISEACDLPLSTTYRKLDVLGKGGLLEEGTRVSLDGNHTSEYVGVVQDLLVSVDFDGGVRIE